MIENSKYGAVFLVLLILCVAGATIYLVETHTEEIGTWLINNSQWILVIVLVWPVVVYVFGPFINMWINRK